MKKLHNADPPMGGTCFNNGAFNFMTTTGRTMADVYTGQPRFHQRK